MFEKCRLDMEAREKALEAEKAEDQKKTMEHIYKTLREEGESKSKQNRVADLKKSVLDKITTKFEKLVEDIKANIEKDYEEERANINITKDLQSKILDVKKQLSQKTSNAQASCAAMAQMKQAEHDQEARQEFNALKAALAPGESLHYASTAIRSRKHAELDAFRASQEAQLEKIRSNIVDEIAKSIETRGAKSAQIQAKIAAKNEKLNTVAKEYDKKIYEFVENTSKYIEETLDNDGNIENVIEQQINAFLQGAALDLSITD